MCCICSRQLPAPTLQFVLCQVHSTFTRYLPFNAEIACPFLASAPCIRPYICPSHPFLASCPMRLPLAVPCVLSALVSSLSCPSVPLSSPARSALCPPRFLSCPPSVRSLSTLPLHIFLPHSPRFCLYVLPHVVCTISLLDSHLISFCLSLRSSTPISH